MRIACTTSLIPASAVPYTSRAERNVRSPIPRRPRQPTLRLFHHPTFSVYVPTRAQAAARSIAAWSPRPGRPPLPSALQTASVWPSLLLLLPPMLLLLPLLPPNDAQPSSSIRGSSTLQSPSREHIHSFDRRRRRPGVSRAQPPLPRSQRQSLSRGEHVSAGQKQKQKQKQRQR